MPPSDVLWDEATLSVGLTDLRGIRSLDFTLDDQPVAFTPGLSKTQLFRSGLQARLPKAGADFAGRAHSFRSGSPSTARACWNSCPWAARPS